MNLAKKVIALVFFFILITGQPQNTTANPSLSKIIEISPSALDVIIHSFDNVIVFFHRVDSIVQLNSILERFQIIKDQIRQKFPSDHALFGYVNMTEDYSRRLERFGNTEGFKVLNRFIPSDKFKNREQQSQLLQAYQAIAHPRLPLKYASELVRQSPSEYNLLFKFTSSQKLREYNQIYEKIKFYLEDLFVGSYAVPAESKENDEIILSREGKTVESYRFSNLTIAEIGSDLVQQVNIDTLPLVSTLNSNNMHRVFGGSINDQILLLFKDSINRNRLKNIKEIFSRAALFNKRQQLAYERVIFAEISEQFFEEQFNEESSTIFKEAGNSAEYAIVFTKTDYDRFNLKKYVLKCQNDLTFDKIISFIEDVRMKRLEPQYKSQTVPSQEENNQTLRKIVGNNFISEVYEKPDQSIIILFIDSKDEESFIDIKRQLQKFAEKHSKQFAGALTFGVFDLAKNEHKLLYLKQAPQIVLFDKVNKKQTKYFKMGQGVSIQLLEKWVASQLSSPRLFKLDDEM